MKAISQNGHPVIWLASETRNWVIPGTGRNVRLAPGHAGFCLAVLALWFNDRIEKIGSGTWDDWGWAVRPVRGQTSGYSNHASGTAIDLNATRHPRGVILARTFAAWQWLRIRAHLRLLGNKIRWGGDYQHSPIDGMHFELVARGHAVTRLAKRLSRTKRGRAVRRANPDYRPPR